MTILQYSVTKSNQFLNYLMCFKDNKQFIIKIDIEVNVEDIDLDELAL